MRPWGAQDGGAVPALHHRVLLGSLACGMPGTVLKLCAGAKQKIQLQELVYTKERFALECPHGLCIQPLGWGGIGHPVRKSCAAWDLQVLNSRNQILL